MLTRDAIRTDEELLRYIERAIAGAYMRVGKGRTDRGDVARILREHGTHSTAVHLAVEQYIRGQLSEPAYDAAGVERAHRQLDELAACGYSADALRRAAPGSHRGGRWNEVREAERAYAEAARGLDAHAGAVDAAIAAWWNGHASTVEALCYRHADALLRARASDT